MKSIDPTPENEMRAAIEGVDELKPLPPALLDGLARFGDMLLEANDQFNLTAIRTPEGVARLHFADSLAPLNAEPAFADPGRAIDIGTGAGFPLIPLAMALPHIRWMGLESTAKKCSFVSKASRELGLRNVRVENQRAEDAGRGDLRGACDIATARAVGPIASLIEVGLPLLRTAGILLLWKMRSAEEELENALDLLDQMGGEALDPIFYRYPEDKQERAIFRIAKIKPTPAIYPRRNGLPFRNPLA
ncbi:16S rRNA (guanine(527)-N(7))-methyltransferase RsmG [candidate division BRC1 bacterium HGW-BRC1-1]|nr:MAG: 16S rRNA (guanine(527)-N(7))-methyltransferase RsmG [candidate division BRC1 bacterium HGW-BRC1-1]